MDDNTDESKEMQPYNGVDPAHFHKGMYLDIVALEQLTGVAVSDLQYRMKVLGVRQHIEMQHGILSKMEGDQLRLLTDAEAVLWNVKRANINMRGVSRAALRTDLIDVRNLNSQQEKVADVTANALKHIDSAMRAEREKHARVLEVLKPLKDPMNKTQEPSVDK